MKNSLWFKGTLANGRGTPIGVCWHDTSAGNPNIKRYVQPFETDENYKELMDIIGENTLHNDWNHTDRMGGVNAFIGKIKDGSIATVQVGDWDMYPWGTGKGSKGSANGYYEPGKYIGKCFTQFEICDDGYKDKEYFKKVYKEACELTAHICSLYNIDPKGTVEFNGMQIPTIICHGDATNYKIGNGHTDVYPWFEKMGKTMDDVRNDVYKILKGGDEPMVEFKLLDEVSIKPEVDTWYNGKAMPKWVKTSVLYVRKINEDGTVCVSTLKEGATTGTVFAKNLVLIEKKDTTPAVESQEETKPNEPISAPVEENNDTEPVEKPAEQPEQKEEKAEEPEKEKKSIWEFIAGLLKTVAEFIGKFFVEKE